jgi:hypothetical protein
MEMKVHDRVIFRHFGKIRFFKTDSLSIVANSMGHQDRSLSMKVNVRDLLAIRVQPARADILIND